LNDKIEKIDLLLSNDIEFEKYINEIDNVEISYSDKIEEKILSKANKQKSVYYFNIFKMVACMTVAIILCQTDYIKSENLNKKENIKQEVVQKNTFINDKVNQIGDFFMKPMNLKEGKK
jgi:hypothetical protein